MRAAARPGRLVFTCIAIQAIGCAVSKPLEPGPTAVAKDRTDEWDCFEVAQRSGSDSVALISPRAAAWDRATQRVLDLPFKLRNVTGHPGAVNVRGSTNVSPLPGDDEISLRFVDGSGRPWQRDQWLKTFVEGSAVTVGDYVYVEAGKEVPLAVRLNRSQYQLPTGDYTVQSCYWDRSDSDKRVGVKALLRGPSVGQVFRLTVTNSR